jgi:acetylornithine deacetylase/succinyl-diaminopimelate desuccinylase-like protein
MGPGRSERSHSADEYIETTELLEAAKLYEDIILAYAEAL